MLNTGTPVCVPPCLTVPMPTPIVLHGVHGPLALPTPRVWAPLHWSAHAGVVMHRSWRTLLRQALTWIFRRCAPCCGHVLLFFADALHMQLFSSS